MAKITQKEHILAQDAQEEQVPVSPADPEQTPTPDPEPTEPTEPAELGITLPDEAAPVEQLTPADRLLAFDTDGNPLTATAQQLKEYATEELTEAIAEKFGLIGNDIDANELTQGSGYSYSKNTPAYGTVASFSGLGKMAYGTLQIACDDQEINSARFWVRNNNQQGFTSWRELWHSGNFNPATKMPLEDYTGDLNAVEGSGVFRLTGDQSNAPFSGSGTGSTLVQYKWDSRAAFQIYYRFLSNEVYMREKTGGFWGSWVKFYHSGNLTPATAASVGLMSAEDKIKLNAVASAMSLSEDEPATMALNQEESVSSEISIRAQRSARYQMQTDELLYDALEAFARNHPEYTEFAEWIAAKDRIRAELAKPETINLD